MTKRIKFEKDIKFEAKSSLFCYLKDEKLIFTSYKKYEGPITLQYLPNGGIQSLFSGLLIVKVNNGFLSVDHLIYKGEEISSSSFIKIVGQDHLLNQILE